MKARAYYNEIDPHAAQWLRNLIDAGHIAPGDVDQRSIEDVRPADLVGYTQCHFFAGIGIWSYALRLAGWPDDRPVWTGSCPCQPFSSAGKGEGLADERHLWPAWFHLIEHGKDHSVPVFGEQVANGGGLAWLDLVWSDLEGTGYAFRAADLCAAGFGAPHIRQRLFFHATPVGAGMANPGQHELGGRDALRGPDGEPAGSEGSNEGGGEGGPVQAGERTGNDAAVRGPGGGMANTDGEGGGAGLRDQGPGEERRTEPADHGGDERVAHPEVGGRGEQRSEVVEGEVRHTDGGGDTPRGPGAVNGRWAAADWLWCRDQKWRPVEPIPQQMVDGLARSMGPLRADTIAKVEEEVLNHANASETGAREALHDVWVSLGAEALRFEDGRLRSVQDPRVLLAFLRQLQDQGWSLAQGIPRPGPEAPERSLRVLWEQASTTCPPHQRGLDGQPTREHSDLVRILPSILARHAQAAWGETFDRHVQNAFPLIDGAPSRVVRLRAYGNGIVSEVASSFIKSCMTP